ncbi:DNA replication complex GINS protein PSF3 [Nymphon striatum]|nr:DNA replication complex GINS protein PSF3 [Nymphon striatum]
MTLSTNQNYFSVHDILASQEKVLCNFDQAVCGLGFLDPSGENQDLVKGMKLELPFWMLQAISQRNQTVASIYELPKGYKESYREILSAEAFVVDLHKLGPFFYQFGLQLLKTNHAENSQIAKMLLQTFQDRVRCIMDSSQNSLNEDCSKLTANLDNMERALFQAGQKGLLDFQKWQIRESEKISTSEIVVNHRKRKLALDS